jgi:hypothetical protein
MRYSSRLFSLSIALVIGATTTSHAQGPTGKITAREVKSDRDVVITYTLSGPAEAEYDVDLFLVWGGTNRQKLERVTGDIGSGIRAGSGKIIHWDMKTELPDPIEGMSYLFQLEINRSRGLAWYWYAGGGAALGGVLYVLLKPKSESPSTTLPNPTIPLPPGR